MFLVRAVNKEQSTIPMNEKNINTVIKSLVYLKSSHHELVSFLLKQFKEKIQNIIYTRFIKEILLMICPK